MDPKPQSEETPENLSPLPENQENEHGEHALVDQKGIGSTHCDYGDIKESKTLETFRTKVLEFARESRMSPEHISLIERSFPDLFHDLHVPNHPPYAVMIHKAITELDEAGGSSEEAISLFIRKEQNDLPWAHATLLKHHLEKLCENGDVAVTGEKCYMLNTTCETYSPNQIESFNPNQIVAFNPNQISASPVPTYSYSPYSSPSSSSSSSSSYSDYTPNEKRRKPKRKGRKSSKTRRGYRKKPESQQEFEINEEEHSEDTLQEEETTGEYEDADEEYHNTDEEVEVTEVENRLIKYKGKETHSTEGAKKNKTEEKSEFRDEHMRVAAVINQVNGTHYGGTKSTRGRGRPLKCSKPKTYIGPKEAQEELIKTRNQVAEVGHKQKRRRGRPSKNIGFGTESRLEETKEQLLETHNQLRGVLNGPKQSHERCSLPKKIGTDTVIRPKEVHKEVMQAYHQKRSGEKRGRGRPPKILGNETNLVQKEARGEVIDAHNQLDCVEKPKQKRGRGRPRNNNSGGQMVVLEVQNQTTEDGNNSGGQMVVLEVQNQTTKGGMKLKQGRRRFRRKHERKEVDKYLDELELTVLEEMFERMTIRSCDDDENVFGAVSPSFPSKACELVGEDKIRKEREQQIQIQSSMGAVELFVEHDWTKQPEKSQELEDMEKLSRTQNQLPQEGREDDAYHCGLEVQACRSELARSQVVHEEEQPEGGPVTTLAPLAVSNYHHENARQEILETKEETSTFMELLHSDYQYEFYDESLDQPKKQSCCGVSRKPTP